MTAVKDNETLSKILGEHTHPPDISSVKKIVIDAASKTMTDVQKNHIETSYLETATHQQRD